jgi:hypothetical protein
LFDQQKAWLDAAAERAAGRKIPVVSVQSDASESANPANPANPTNPPDPGSRIPDPDQAPEKKRDLKAEAMSSSTVQAMLDVFPAEIRDVEETP